MYGRIRPDTSPELSGTGFMEQTSVDVEADKVSPNADPLGKGIAPPDSKAAKGDNVKTKAKAKA